MIRTRTSVILDDASIGNLFSDDEYVRQRRPRSVLCLPIIKQAKLVGTLYLENNLTSHAFTPGRISVLEFLASQAAISLENDYLYADLQRSAAFLAEGQSISHTGSFGWSVASGKIFWSEETFRIFEYERTTTPTVELVLRRVHPQDAALVRQTIERVSQDGQDFSLEYRICMPDGRVKYLEVVAHASDNLEFVGAVMDITERKVGEGERELLGQRLR